MIQFDIDAQKALRRLTSLRVKQVPFATAIALTRTVVDIQKHFRTVALRKRFIIRRQFVPRGIVFTKASKTNFTATVFSRDDFMQIQETGGTQRPKSGNKVIPIPTKNLRKNKRSSIGRARFPSKLLRKDNVVLIRTKKGSSIVRRSKRTIKTLYTLKAKTKIKPRFKFKETARNIARKNFGRNFGRALSEAVRTAR